MKKILRLAFLLAATSCLDPQTPKMQYVPDMADAPFLKPQRNYLEPPEHSVATTALLYPETAEIAEKNLRNPLPATQATVDAGKHWYNTFCVNCHGADGKGVGSITDVYMPAPNLTVADYEKRGDGFFFHRITFGAQAIMPPYGHAITPTERWQIVHYLRVLQKNGGH